MPQIIVTAHDDDTTVTMRERINVSDFESERFAANLVERLGWAVDDAAEVEYAKPERKPEPKPEPAERERNRPITGSSRRESKQDRPLEPAGSA